MIDRDHGLSVSRQGWVDLAFGNNLFKGNDQQPPGKGAVAPVHGRQRIGRHDRAKLRAIFELCPVELPRCDLLPAGQALHKTGVETFPDIQFGRADHSHPRQPGKVGADTFAALGKKCAWLSRGGVVSHHRTDRLDQG